jgi:hypothetical protein
MLRIGLEKPIPEEIDHREFVIRMSVVKAVPQTVLKFSLNIVDQ